VVTAFKKHIAAHFPALADQKILVACSGGLDSIVLLHLLQKIGLTLGVAHCNFKLRGAHSDADLSFVETIAANLGVPVFTTFLTLKRMLKPKESLHKLLPVN